MHTGRLLAERDITLVYGGGSVGLMGILADACLEAGGRVVGVITRWLMDREVGHRARSPRDLDHRVGDAADSPDVDGAVVGRRGQRFRVVLAVAYMAGDARGRDRPGGSDRGP